MVQLSHVLPDANSSGSSGISDSPATTAATAVTSFVSAALCGLYEGNVRYRSKPQSRVKLQSVQLLVDAADEDVLGAAAAKGVALARGTLMAR